MQRVLAVATSGKAVAVLPYGRWRLEVLFEGLPLGVYVLEDSVHGCMDFHGSATQEEIEHRPEGGRWNTWVGFLVKVRARDRQTKQAITEAELPNLTSNELQRLPGGDMAFWVSALRQKSYPHYVQAPGYARRGILVPQPIRPLERPLVVDLEPERVLAGVLRDVEGRHLPEGSRVTFQLGGHQKRSDVHADYFMTQLRAGGRFRIGNLPPEPLEGELQVWKTSGEDRGLWVGSTGRISGEVDLRLEPHVPSEDE